MYNWNPAIAIATDKTIHVWLIFRYWNSNNLQWILAFKNTTILVQCLFLSNKKSRLVRSLCWFISYFCRHVRSLCQRIRKIYSQLVAKYLVNIIIWQLMAEICHHTGSSINPHNMIRGYIDILIYWYVTIERNVVNPSLQVKMLTMLGNFTGFFNLDWHHVIHSLEIQKCKER